MISALFRFIFRKPALLLCATLALAACSPSYNWRELELADGQVKAAFPDRTQAETRDLKVGEHSLSFTLTGARVNDAVFAVGYAPLPPDIARDPAARASLGQALVRSRYIGLGVPPPDTFPENGQAFVVHGKTGNEPGTLHARVWVTDTLLVEAMAIGSDRNLPAERANEFLGQVVVKP